MAGKKHGPGVYKLKSGDELHEGFVHGEREGPAEFRFRDGSSVKMEKTLNGLPTGHTTYRFSDGTTIDCTLLGDTLSGSGTYSKAGVSLPCTIRNGTVSVEGKDYEIDLREKYVIEGKTPRGEKYVIEAGPAIEVKVAKP